MGVPSETVYAACDLLINGDYDSRNMLMDFGRRVGLHALNDDDTDDAVMIWVSQLNVLY